MEKEDPANPTPPPVEATPEPASEVAMYCSPTPLTAPDNTVEPSWPMFLTNARPDFWDGF